MAERPSISFGDRVGITSTTLRAMLTASVRACTSPFRGYNGASNYYKDVIFSLMRTSMGNLNIAQDAYSRIFPSTTETYLKYCEDHGITPESLTLPSGTQAHWLGNKNAKKVILWFHAGGYVVQAMPGHFVFLKDLMDLLNANGSDTAVLVLSYSLAPEYKYPTQLTQAIECLRYLVQKTDRIPSDITIGGDSAGGNLAIGVLSHLAHPHPEIPALHLPTKLHAVLAISPWCSFNTNTPAHDSNKEKDCIDRRPLQRWATAFLGTDWPFAGDFYNEPVTAPASWWEPVAAVVGEVLIWGGADEVLIDGVEEFGRRFTKGFTKQGGRVNVIVTPKAAHVEPVMERILGYNGDSGSGAVTAVSDWARAKL